MWGIVSCFYCQSHSHNALYNVYTVALDRTRSKENIADIAMTMSGKTYRKKIQTGSLKSGKATVYPRYSTRDY